MLQMVSKSILKQHLPEAVNPTYCHVPFSKASSLIWNSDGRLCWEKTQSCIFWPILYTVDREMCGLFAIGGVWVYSCTTNCKQPQSSLLLFHECVRIHPLKIELSDIYTTWLTWKAVIQGIQWQEHMSCLWWQHRWSVWASIDQEHIYLMYPIMSTSSIVHNIHTKALDAGVEQCGLTGKNDMCARVHYWASEVDM